MEIVTIKLPLVDEILYPRYQILSIKSGLVVFGHHGHKNTIFAIADPRLKELDLFLDKGSTAVWDVFCVVLRSKHLLVDAAYHQILWINEEVRILDEIPVHLLIVGSAFLQDLSVFFFQILLIVTIKIIRKILLWILLVELI